MYTTRPQTCHVVNKFEGIYAQRFVNLCKILSAHSSQRSPDPRAVGDLINAELVWLDQQHGNEIDTLRYRAFVLILLDLLQVSWRVVYSSQGIEIVAPPMHHRHGLTQAEQSGLKDAVRDTLSVARDEQLTEPAVQKFIRAMEEPSPAHKHHMSIKQLLADGAALAERLRGICELPTDEQVKQLGSTIQPYLVLVEPEERDPYTGIKYSDIWRYFRLTWAIPNIPAPGRKLFYLVRDAAHPSHAVMAIAALSNAALQVKDRDEYIGWTAESVIYRLRRALATQDYNQIEAIIRLMEQHVERGLLDTDPTGIVEPHEIACPTEVVLRRLQASSEGFSQARQRQLQLSLLDVAQGDEAENESFYDAALEAGLTNGDVSSIGIPYISDAILDIDKKANRRSLEARRQLIFKKRSQSLYQLLSARRVFQQLRAAPRLSDAITTALPREDFRAALTYAVFANKRERAGINLLEITTCGAIPPYNYLLGGKLMALLLLSPQVVADYRSRYKGQPSWISSQIKGEQVVRESNLVFLSTTSLYAVGSSQYNRVVLPAGTFHPQQPRIEYKSRPSQADIRDGGLRRPDGKDWQTSGFGTVHFSSDTTAAIVELGIHESGYREVNNIFGEGPSPKLRKIRAGLLAVGLEPEVLLRHNQPRLLYCVDLCAESRRFLNGEQVQLPEYITHPERIPDATERIADYWRRRWLISRLRTPGVLDQVAQFTPESFTPRHSAAARIPKEVSAAMTSPSNPIHTRQSSAPSDTGTPADSSPSPLTVQFLQLLYLKRRSYADFLDSSLLDALHIATPLDDFITRHINDGYSIVLTGNAGDGKTHLLKWLKHQLDDVRMVEDASLHEPQEIVDKWRQAIADGKPFCLAANEWPLLELIDQHVDQFPLLHEVDRQLKTSLVYDDQTSQAVTQPVDQDKIHERVLVINLDLRNPLASEFVDAVMQTLLKPDIFAGCTTCHGSATCDAVRNRRLLMNHQRVGNAFKTLLGRLSIFSRHITVRELLGFLSYTIFGGRDCAMLVREHGKNSGFYSEQMFSEQAHGPIFGLLRAHLDPANISHPKWDAHLCFSGTRDADWELGQPPLPPALAKDAHSFQFLKRRFFFEHTQGPDVLKALPDDERNFAALLDPDNHDLDLGRDDLVRAINAFFCYELSTPAQNPNNELIVWSTHSYDERVPRAFTSWFSIDRQHIQLQRPRLTPRLAGAFDYRPNHLRLAVTTQHGPVTLAVDFDLYRTLTDVQRGLPAVLVDEGRSVRLFRFMSRLEAVRPVSPTVSMNLPSDLLDISISVDLAAIMAGSHMASNMLRRRSDDDFLSGFIRDVGVRCGIIKPRAAQQRRKHIDLQADTLEAIVLTLLDPINEQGGIRVETFAERLWERYGLIFDGLRQGEQDHQILGAMGIEDANQDDLKNNSDSFIQRLVALGLARSYADGYSVVQCPQ